MQRLFHIVCLAGLAWLLGASAAYGQVPTITSVTPALGKPGNQILIGGGNFTAATMVKFDQTLADFSVLSANQILAVVPNGATVGNITVANASSGGTSASVFIVPPGITNLSPTQGAAGTPVTINGANFLPNATTVRFNGGAATSVTVTAPTQLQVIVPAGATSGFITISNAAGTTTSTNLFVVSSGPAISDFSPLIGPTGTTVQINGANFVSGGTTVRFNGIAATSVTLTSTTQLQAVVPSGATAGPITIMTANGTVASWTNFITGSQPLITDFYTSATEFSTRSRIGAAGDPVTIEGFNFLGTTTVKFNGTAVANGGITSISANRIQAIVPAGTTTGPLSVTTPAGSGTNTASFITSAGPLVTDFSPVIGSGGQIVVINGLNFSAVTTVKFNTTTVAVTPTATTQISVPVPAGATTGPITVGTNVTTTNFTVIGTGPFISDFSPTNGPRGTDVVFNGANLASVTGVQFNGVSSPNFSATSATQLRAEVPAAATTGTISITAPAGTTTTSGPFYVPPRLNNFTPTNGVVGTTLTFSGTNFTGTTSVTFSGTSSALVPAVFTVVSANTLTAVVPTNAATGPLTLTTPAGPIISTTSFGVVPRVDSFTPTLGPAGTPVTVNGLNFDTATSVRFNGTNAVFTLSSPTQLVATAPSGAGIGPLTVVSPSGTGTSVNNFILTVATDLVVTQSFSPGIILVGQPLLYTIIVSNKGPSIVTGVVLTDTLPPSVTVLSAVASAGTISLANGVIIANLGILTNGTSATIFLTVTPAVSGIFQNRATVAAVEGDLISADNFSETLAPVISDAERTLTILPLPATREVLISWPNSVVTFQLQFNLDLLSSGNVWTNVATPATLVTNQSVVENHVTNSTTALRMFFRLKSP